MAVKTFGTEVLTSADTNTYLANAGLVYVKSQTVGTAVSSVTVSSAFSSTYDNYRILYTDGIASANTIGINMKLGSLVTGYYSGIVNVSYSTAVVSGIGQNNDVIFNNVGSVGSQNYPIVDCDIYAPFLVRWTYISSRAVHYGANFGNQNGLNVSISSVTDFTLSPASGTLTGGTITVYGYRKA